jgi:hypothetical protein
MPDEVTDEMVRQVMRELGSRGGSAKVPKGTAALSAEERAALGRKGAQARWGKKRKGKKAAKKKG